MAHILHPEAKLVKGTGEAGFENTQQSNDPSGFWEILRVAPTGEIESMLQQAAITEQMQARPLERSAQPKDTLKMLTMAIRKGFVNQQSWHRPKKPALFSPISKSSS